VIANCGHATDSPVTAYVHKGRIFYCESCIERVRSWFGDVITEIDSFSGYPEPDKMFIIRGKK
jgi:hypothetical protein